MSSLVIYHAKCVDGTAAAYIASKKLPSDAIFLARPAGQAYDEEILRAAERRDVFYVDISATRQQIETVCAKARTVTVIDHHKTAREELTGFRQAPSNLKIFFDMERCGAVLTWYFFYHSGVRQASETRTAPGDSNWEQHFTTPGAVEVPLWLQYIQDRDLWTWKMPKSREFSAWLYSFGSDSPDVHEAFNAMRLAEICDMKSVVVDGEAILRTERQRVARLVERACIERITGPNSSFYDVPCVNASLLISEVGEQLNAKFPDAPFTATWFVNEKRQKVWSLRVGQSKTFDASVIAKFHGGGGHAKACGFTEDLK